MQGLALGALHFEVAPAKGQVGVHEQDQLKGGGMQAYRLRTRDFSQREAQDVEGVVLLAKDLLESVEGRAEVDVEHQRHGLRYSEEVRVFESTEMNQSMGDEPRGVGGRLAGLGLEELLLVLGGRVEREDRVQVQLEQVEVVLLLKDDRLFGNAISKKGSLP